MAIPFPKRGPSATADTGPSARSWGIGYRGESAGGDRGIIRLWLALAAVIVLLTLSIGGMTRLTNSGLSITEWDPVMGIIPPLSLQEWQVQFDKYKSTYEFQFVNMHMTLDEFRTIFNWEWRHRLVARLVFLAVFIPFIVFLLAGRLSNGLQRKIFVVLGLIVLQGFIGWFMVQSGLRSDVKVSPYRLALHLGLASLLFAMLVAMALGQDDRPLPPAHDVTTSRLWGRVLIGLLFGLILFGALVAGLRGGRTHDTWPLMEGRLIPGNMFVLSPWLSNIFENPLTTQWIHRLLAYALVITTALHWRGTLRRDEPEAIERGAFWLLIAVCVQVLLGIVTVLNQVPIPLGLAHQLWAFGLLTLAIWHLYEIERHTAGPIDNDTWGEAVASPAMTTPMAPPMAQASVGASTTNPALRPPTTASSPGATYTPPVPTAAGLATASLSRLTTPVARPAGFPSIGGTPATGDRATLVRQVDSSATEDLPSAPANAQGTVRRPLDS